MIDLGTYNVLKTAPIVTDGGNGERFYLSRNERLMLGMSVDKATAEMWLQKYRDRYPQMSFEIVADAPAFTVSHLPGIGLVKKATAIR